MGIYADPVPLGLSKSEYNKALYNARKEAGLCARCGKSPVRKGHVMCAQCEADIAAWHYAKKAQLTPEEREAYLARERARNQARRDRLKAQGLCIDCGEHPTECGKLRCKACAAKHNRETHERKIRAGELKQYRELGLCLHCGAERVPGKMYCPDCLAKKRKALEKAWAATAAKRRCNNG